MLRKVFLPSIFIILGYGFWISPDFKEIAAGVAIFLFGMLALEEGFKAFSGGLLENVLKKSTDKLYKSIGFGIVTTSLMQSSSLVSILTISFLGAELIGLTQGIGIIFGANIGTTTGAWLVAGLGLKVKISAYAMPILVFGVILIFQKSKSLKGFGYILAGLGFLFLGIHYMKDGFEAFKSAVDLSQYAVSGYKGIFIFTGLGILATVIMQSSHATLVLIIVSLAAGQITYENALALAIGANVGTTITAIIGSFSSNINGKRLAGAHLIFNVITGSIAILFINQLMIAVDWTSNFVGIKENDYTLKLAVFHTFFNLIGVIVMIPFINRLVIFLNGLDFGVKHSIDSVVTAKYLNESVMELPGMAIEVIVKETKHLYENAYGIICKGFFINPEEVKNIDIEEEDVLIKSCSNSYFDIEKLYIQKIKGLYNEIITFTTISQSKMESDEIEEANNIKSANRDIVEAIKDTKHLQKNFLKYCKSTNEYIREEYNKLRISLVTVLRYVYLIENSTTEADIAILLSELEVHINDIDIIQNGSVDSLIRENKIESNMATSLINDNSYLRSISKNLLETAKVIFMRNLLDEVSLDKEEIDSILKTEKDDEG